MLKRPLAIAASLVVLSLLGGCATVPDGPSVLVLPGTGKSFDQFRADDLDCRQFASSQIGGSASSAANESGVRSAAVGTLLGAAAGAAIGGNHGAGVGAGAGLLMGGLSGVDAGNASAHGMQRRYDNAFEQCMYAKGHRVPMNGRFANDQRSTQASAPAASIPPPPAGMPPPPPPDARSRY